LLSFVVVFVRRARHMVSTRSGAGKRISPRHPRAPEDSDAHDAAGRTPVARQRRSVSVRDPRSVGRVVAADPVDARNGKANSGSAPTADATDFVGGQGSGACEIGAETTTAGVDAVTTASAVNSPARAQSRRGDVTHGDGELSLRGSPEPTPRRRGRPSKSRRSGPAKLQVEGKVGTARGSLAAATAVGETGVVSRAEDLSMSDEPSVHPEEGIALPRKVPLHMDEETGLVGAATDVQHAVLSPVGRPKRTDSDDSLPVDTAQVVREDAEIQGSDPYSPNSAQNPASVYQTVGRDSGHSPEDSQSPRDGNPSARKGPEMPELFIEAKDKLSDGTVSLGMLTQLEPAASLESFVREAVKRPQLFLTRSQVTKQACRWLVREVYNNQTSVKPSNTETGPVDGQSRKKRRFTVPLGPLAEIEVNASLEADQVWEQLSLRNRPLLPHLSRAIGHATRVVDQLEKTRKSLESNVPISTEKEGTAVNSDDIIQTPSTAIEIEVAGDQSAAVDADAESDCSLPAETKEAAIDPDDIPPTCQKKVRFSIDNATNLREDDKPNSKDVGKRTSRGIEDGFFSVADMEAFADEAEELAANGKLAGSDEDDGTSSEDLEGNGDVLGQIRSTVVDSKVTTHKSKTVARVRYHDFFDTPDMKYDGGANEEKNEGDPAFHRAHPAGSGDDSDDSSDMDDDIPPATPLDLERSKLRATMDAIEDANVGKKPWQLKGEVHAHARPLNSMLESDFEHDIAVRPKVAPDMDASASIEDIIRQRIFDGLFDDVVRKLPLEYEEAKRKSHKHDVPDVSQEKPAEGLAELYEREFAEERQSVSKASEAASGTVKRSEDSADNPEQAEVNRLFKRLSTKLDALTSLHFTPPPPKAIPEMEVKPNVPALAAEEAIPEAVSDAALLAAREVHVAKPSEAQTDAEMNKDEKAKRRRTKKRRTSAQNKQKVALQHLEERADPALADKRRAERTLQRPGKLLKTVTDPNDKGRKKSKSGRTRVAGIGQPAQNVSYSKSTKFFTELQSTVANDISGTKKRSLNATILNDVPSTAAKLKL
jgi:U3 small nucleolar RNA-associated protein MPP10